MQDTVDSVKQNGVAVPAIVRPSAESGYKLVAGHSRKRASQQAGLANMPHRLKPHEPGPGTQELKPKNKLLYI